MISIFINSYHVTHYLYPFQENILTKFTYKTCKRNLLLMVYRHCRQNYHALARYWDSMRLHTVILDSLSRLTTMHYQTHEVNKQ
ncbi:hypothetical protein GFK82_00628 [Candidatus Steffania adelgidicola]|nr:hypothetical protein GFK82_00628 [Candidatus Steffania adelgidicola]